MSDQLIEEIKSKLDIVDIVSEHVQLKKSGRSYTGFCPFHANSRTPAFVVWPDGTWHCFGTCNTGGDVFDFYQRIHNTDFPTALREMARRANVDLAPMTPEQRQAAEHQRQRQDQINTLLTVAAGYYQDRMWAWPGGDNGPAMAWALRRFNYNAAILQTTGWGWSDSSDGLLKRLVTSDHTDLIPIAKEIGLIRKDGRDFTANSDGWKTALDGWITYTHWKNGRIIAMSARAVGNVTDGGKTRNMPGQRPAYWATTPMHVGNHILARLHDDSLIITEGVPDADTLRAWGWPAVGTMGAPATNDNDDMAIIKRMAKNRTIYLGNSNDEPGLRYTYDMAEVLGPLTRVITWPSDDGQKSDANQLFQLGWDECDASELITTSPAYLDILIDRASDMRRDEKASAIEHLAELIAGLDDTERMLYTKAVIDQLKIPKRAFDQLLSKYKPSDDQTGVHVENGNLSLWSSPLLRGTAWVSNELIIDNGQSQPIIQYTMGGALPDNTPLPVGDIMAEELDNTNWISKLWGARVYAYVGRGKAHELKRAILEFSMARGIQRDRVHTFTGWTEIDGERSFLTASGALNHSLDPSARVTLENNLAHYSLPSPPTGQDLIKAIRASLRSLNIAPLGVTTPLWAAMYAAPLTPIKSLDSVMCIYGPTQSKKSTLSHVMLAHYGAGFVKGRQYKAPQDWISTGADIEVLLFTCKDVPIIIDDYAPQFANAAEAANMARAAHRMIRSVGNRSSKGRRMPGMAAQQRFPPRGLVIMTSEQPLIGASIVGRMVYVFIERGCVDLDMLTACQAEHHLYSQSMSAYISWLASNWDIASKMFDDAVAESLDHVTSKFTNMERLADYYAVLNAASIMALTWMVDAGGITPQESDQLAELHSQTLLDVLQSQGQSIAKQSPVLKFMVAIEDMLLQGIVVLAPKEDPNFRPPFGTTMIGWKSSRERVIYLLKHPALAKVKEYWASMDEHFATLPDALGREIQQYDLLANRDPRQYETKPYINAAAGRPRVLEIDSEKVKSLFDVDLMHETDSKI